jgi:hypothetical protein
MRAPEPSPGRVTVARATCPRESVPPEPEAGARLHHRTNFVDVDRHY